MRLLAAGLLLMAGLAHAGLPPVCAQTAEPTAAQQDRLLRFAAVLREALDASGARIALIARSGTDLDRFGLRYSHAGLALREGLGSPWTVRQLYYDCATGGPRLFDQGLAGFVAGTDRPERSFVSLLPLPDAAGNPLERAALDTPLVLRLLAARYSANAYPFSTRYQNCNQWVAELFAAAYGEAREREAAQAWLQGAGYAPEPVDVGSPWLMLAGRFVPWLHFDDQPPEQLQALRMQTSLPRSLETFLRQRWPDTPRIEFCQTAAHWLRHEGAGELDAACSAAPPDAAQPWQ